MFNVGGPELIVIAVVALIVLGPDKLPGALRQAGRIMGELRRISAGFQTDLRTAIADAERGAEESSGDQSTANGSAVDSGRRAALAELEALDPDSTSTQPQADADAESNPPIAGDDRPRD